MLKFRLLVVEAAGVLDAKAQPLLFDLEVEAAVVQELLLHKLTHLH
jgi:hypothetical protein